MILLNDNCIQLEFNSIQLDSNSIKEKRDANWCTRNWEYAHHFHHLGYMVLKKKQLLKNEHLKRHLSIPFRAISKLKSILVGWDI